MILGNLILFSPILMQCSGALIRVECKSRLQLLCSSSCRGQSLLDFVQHPSTDPLADRPSVHHSQPICLLTASCFPAPPSYSLSNTKSPLSFVPTPTISPIKPDLSSDVSDILAFTLLHPALHLRISKLLLQRPDARSNLELFNPHGDHRVCSW